ncbi:hypothetical protein SNE40_018095 [Patella caerulea]|uniref:Uncharacterized protein n=1 Tax=Patella caerulea TaxID=87958 RepID=A0AAN8J933_PATCE
MFVSVSSCHLQLDVLWIVNHELMLVPVALVETNRSLGSGNKSVLGDILTSDVDCPEWIDLNGRFSSLVIDGQARVLSIGKPANAISFGDLADAFTNSIYRSGTTYDRVDVVFDRYRDESIKSQTRQRRSQTTGPIRHVGGRDVPLPHSWTNFIALPGNKADLARYLSEELLENAPHDKEVVVAGGFADEKEVKFHKSTVNLD